MILLNVAAIIAYLEFAKLGWVEPEVADIPGAAGGGAVVWGLTALPTLLVFIVINFLWLIYEVSLAVRGKIGRLSLIFWAIPVLAIPLMWVIAVKIDYSHHGV